MPVTVVTRANIDGKTMDLLYFTRVHLLLGFLSLCKRKKRNCYIRVIFEILETRVLLIPILGALLLSQQTGTDTHSSAEATVTKLSHINLTKHKFITAAISGFKFLLSEMKTKLNK